MPHVHDDHCLKARLLPSGVVTLECAHTGCPVLHLGNHTLHIERLCHDPHDHANCCVCLKASFKVPLECGSHDKLELVGGWVQAAGCNCHHDHGYEGSPVVNLEEVE